MVHCKRLLAAACLACALPGTAAAQYYVNLALTPLGPGTCGSSGISVPVTGTIDINLPAGVDNVWESVTVVGEAPVVTTKTIGGPFPQSSPGVGNLSLPTNAPVAPPYTLVTIDYPAQGGFPVGIGTRVTAECSVTGVAIVTFLSGLPVPVAAPVPALSGFALALLATLLAAATALLRRQPR